MGTHEFPTPPAQQGSIGRDALNQELNHHLDERIAQYDRHIHAMDRQCTVAQRLMQLMGIGEVSKWAGVRFCKCTTIL